MKRSAVASCAACLACLVCISAVAQQAATPADARAALLERAEAALARGDTSAATETFDRAASMLHAPDTEMGLVRAYMQAGQYRRALAFGAHVAGAHIESASAGAQYAWLLRAGGQAEFADRVLRETLARAPQDPVALEVRRAFEAPWPVAAGALLQSPQRVAPEAVMAAGQPAPPDTARIVSSGVLIGGGTLALIPNAVARAAPAGMLWVRNGLGHTTRARIDGAAQSVDALEPLGVTVLRLDAALEAGEAPHPAPREPFAGSAGFAIEYAASDRATPAWPWMRQGFLGAFQGQSQGNGGLRRLGIEVADGPHGGPVLDAGGHLAGMVLPGSGSQTLMLPASRWQVLTQAGATLLPATPAGVQPARAARPSSAMPADQAYESALRIALQVIALP